MSAERITKPKKRAVVAVAVAVVLLVSAYAGVRITRRAQEFEVPVNSYNASSDATVVDARVDMHPDFEVCARKLTTRVIV